MRTRHVLLHVILVFCILVTPVFINAGELRGVAFKGSLNISNVHDRNWSFIGDNEKKLGWSAGLCCDFEIVNNFSIYLNLLYSIKGYKLAFNEELSPYLDDRVFNMNYIEIPILFKYSTKSILKAYTPNIISPYVYFGPYLGILLSSKYKSELGNFDLYNVSKTDAGLIIGAGLRIDDSFLEISYSRGLKTIDYYTTNIQSEPDVLKHNCFIISFGIFIS